MRGSGTKAYLSVFLVALAALVLGAGAPKASAKKCEDEEELELEIAKIYWEYNSSANDLGVHVKLDGEDWVKMRIFNPDGKTIFRVEGRRGYKELGLTELFFEGAEPTLDEFPLEDLLDLFPEGEYEFEGRTIDGCEISGEAYFSHAIPAGPEVSTSGISGSTLVISWDPVDDTPDGFPDEEINIVGYEVIVEGDDDRTFDIILPGDATQVTVPPEFVDSLSSGEHAFEVLAIDESGNQTITEGSVEK